MIELKTPCGCLNLFDEKGGFVSFDVNVTERTHLKIYDGIVEEHIPVISGERMKNEFYR